MKHKMTYICTAALVLLLCTVMLCAPISAVHADQGTLPSLNYGIPDSEGNITVGATELYELLFSSSPSKAERKYLELNGITLTYNNTMPSNLISTDYDSDAGVLTVTIRPYSYTANNGETVTWVPTHASIDGETCEIQKEGELYVGHVGDLYASKDFEVEVDYKWEVTIPQSAIEQLRNSAYYTGADGIALREEYQNTFKAWQEQMDAHEDRNNYLIWKEATQDVYLEQLAVYNAAKQAYDNYARQYAAYEEAVKLYERWQDYYDYEEYAKENLESYNKYITYKKQYDAAKEKLALMEYIFIVDSRRWQLYGAITGDTVSFVLTQEDLLVQYLGYKESFIRKAGDATLVLRDLLPKYNNLRNAVYKSDYERTKALYAFYTENYDTLKQNFCDLYAVLRDLFEADAVQRKLIVENKYDHYIQFLGQLYIISTCFDEKGDRNPDWSIADQKLNEVVEPCQMLPDGDWHPANSPMPQKEVPPVEYMEPVTRPEGTQPSRYPTPPMPEVKDPGEPPAAPIDPWNGKYPPEAAHPGEAPKAPVFDKITSSLMDEIDAGKLTLFTGSTSPQTLQFDATVKQNASFRNYKTVTFYDHEHKELASFQVEYGTSVSYKVPDRASTVQYTYSDGRWISFDGQDFNLSYVTTNLALYPTYKRTLQTYRVTWIFEGESYSKFWQYGDIPTPSPLWSLSTYEKEHYRYTFSGWDTEVGPVTGDVTYRGEMIATILEYEVTWVLYNDVKVTERYPALTVPTYTGELTRPADNCRYNFNKWINHGTPLTGNTVYYASWDTVKLAGGGLGNSELDIEHTAEEIRVDAQTHPLVNIHEVLQLAEENGKALILSWGNGMQTTLNAEQLASFREAGATRILLQEKKESRYTTFRIGFTDNSGNAIGKLENGVSVTLPVSYDENAQPVFFVKVGDEYQKLTDTTLLLTEETVIYTAISYFVNVTPDEHCNTMTVTPMVLEGDTVSLNLQCMMGYEILGATVRDADGNLIPVAKDLTFVMPSSPVTVTLEVSAIRYTLTFMVDGKVWETQEYAFGEEIKLPKNPSKEPANDYIFTFVGWGEVPSLATGSIRNMVFTATFSEAKQNIDYTTGEGGSFVLDVLLPIALVVLPLAIAGLITWLIVRRCTRKRRMLRKPAPVPSDEPKATMPSEGTAIPESEKAQEMPEKSTEESDTEA